jgi:hypothetical protein
MTLRIQRFTRQVAGLATWFFILACGIGLLRAADPGPGELWVTSQGTDRLFILPVGECSSIDAIQLPTGTGPNITTFPPSSQYAYISGMGNGSLLILRADDRQIVQTLSLGPAGTHQAKPSPDGTVLLVAQIPSRTLIKVAANEAAESWSVVGSLSLPAAPVCTVFRDDGQRAYVSLRPSGIAVVDVPTMTLLNILPTDGFVACGMIKSKVSGTVTIASSGGGGHIYRLDTTTDTLSDAGTLGAADWLGFNMSPNERVGYGSSPQSGQLILVDLSGPAASNLGALTLNPTPGAGDAQPDAIAVRGTTVFVSLGASGKLAIVKANQGTATFLDMFPPTPSNPANCTSCAIDGVTVRP